MTFFPRLAALAGALSGVAWAAAMLGACDGDDTPARTLPDAAGMQDTSPLDSTTDGPIVPDSGPRAKLVLVHAGPDVPAVRVCFAVGTKIDGSDVAIVPIPPLPDQITGAQPYPGVFPGTGGVFPDLGVDLSARVIIPYVIIASAVKDDVRSDAGPPKLNCAELLSNGPNALPSPAYLKLPLIPAGTLATGKTLLLAATGCLPNDPQGAALCGANYDSTLGNVALRIFELDNKSTATAAQIGTQLMHLSSAVEGKLQGSITASLIGPVDASAGDAFVLPMTTNVHFGDLSPKTAIALALTNVDQTALFVSVQNPDSGAPLQNVVVPLSLVYQTTTGQSSGADQYFKTGANYTFVVLGDPAEPNQLDSGTFNGKSLHFLAFPSDPPVKSYP